MLLASGYFKDNFTLHVVCAALSSLLATIFGSPFDVVKTRVMTARNAGGVVKYKGSGDCIMKAVKGEVCAGA